MNFLTIFRRRRIRRLAHEVSTGATTRQSAGLTEQRNLLRSRIRSYEQLLAIYMPGLLQYRLDQENAPATTPAPPDPPSTQPDPPSTHSGRTKRLPKDKIEYADIWLPSKVDPTARRRICREGVPRIEERLRTVQLEDALENIRHILKVKTRMVQFKNKNIRGQRDGTRSRTIIDRVHQKARATAEKYRNARVAKLALSGPGDWEMVYKPLNDSDIRGYQDTNRLRSRGHRRGIYEDDQLQALADASADAAATAISNTVNGVEGSEVELFDDERTRRDGTGETRRTLSWIWVSDAATAALLDDGIPDEEDEEDITRSEEILQAEWAKSRARATRWTEEVMLLKEEMRRALAFLNWRAQW